jgi:putative DNA primase/helicase
MNRQPFSLHQLDDDMAEYLNAAEIGGHDENGRMEDAQLIDREAVAALARLSPMEYDRRREEEAEQLGCRVGTLDKLVVQARKDSDPNTAQGSELVLPEPEPWPDPVDGAALLTDLSTAIRSYVFMPETAADATALWVVHTYLVQCFPISPRLFITSPERNCGKSTLVDVVEKTSWRPLSTQSIQPAGIFRVAERWQPTLLLDEVDGMSLEENEALLSILNSGHKRGGRVIRCEGDKNEPRAFNVFGACALALIGGLPSTLESRSIPVELRRALQGEVKRKFRYDRSPELEILARMARRWADDNRIRIGNAEPDTDGLFNRDADNWRPLFAIADVAGGDWPERARAAAQESCKPSDEQSTRVLLLRDIRDVFNERGVERLPSADLAEALGAMEGRPWAEWKNGKPMTPTALARQLSHFKITPSGTIRVGGRTAKGYDLASFIDAFGRYIPPQTVTPSQTQQTSAQLAHFEPSQDADVLPFETPKKPNNHRICDGVTVGSGVCAQCGEDDGKATYHSISGSQVRLHPQCYKFYKDQQALLGNGGDPPTVSTKPSGSLRSGTC